MSWSRKRGAISDDRRKVLTAALRIGKPFTVEDLTIECWLNDEESFGLAGYEGLSADVRKVATKLYGVRGLIAQGLLRKISSLRESTPRYDVTEVGKQCLET
jgi:hypothetical protein